MRRKIVILVPSLALALLLVGGLWPTTDPGKGRDGGLQTAIAPHGLQPQPAGAISVPFLFSLDIQLRHNHRQAIYVGQVLCVEGRQLRVRVTLTQDHGAQGWGQTIDRCTGETQQFEVRVNARGPVAFRPGEFRYTGWAGEFERGRMTDEATWPENGPGIWP
jgi:hypothetical protein